jgi:hypothetical protein
MSYFPHGAIVAAHAAREARRRQEQEEEEMTKYTNEDLEQNWEFKIVRAYFPVFRKPEVFQSLLEEEALAGWELVEKLDDQRIRFKRRKQARRNDAALPFGIDPYRTQYGRNTNTTGIVIGIISALLLMGIVLGAYLIKSPAINFEGDVPWILIGTVIPVLIAIVGVAVVIIVRLRRG